MQYSIGYTTYERLRTNFSHFYAKQSQFQIRQNKRKHLLNKHLGLIGHLVIQTKQSQNKPNLTQFKANLSQNKPNQSQFVERAKMNAFAWIRSLKLF